VGVASWLGVGGWRLLALYGGTVAFGARWWRHIRPPYPAGPPDKAPPPEDDDYPTRWAKRIGNAGGALPGSGLTNYEDGPYGDSWTVTGVPGRDTLPGIMQALPRIASGLMVPRRLLVLEPDESELEHCARLQVLRESPVTEGLAYDGPRYASEDGGVIEVGLYIDGQGWVTWRLWDDTGCWSGLVVGSTGAGKTGFLEQLVAAAMDTGRVVFFYIDGQNGTSSPLLADEADWFAGVDADQVAVTAPTVVEALKRLCAARQLQNRIAKRNKWYPTPEDPMILVVVDECQRVWETREQAKAWDDLVRTCRKLGIGVIAAGQDITLEGFAKLDTLRAQLLAGNLVAFRVMSKSSKSTLAGMQMDPGGLPEAPGYAFKGGGGERPAVFRGRYIPEKTTDPNYRRAPADVFAELPHLTLSDDESQCVGPAYRMRREGAASQAEMAEAAYREMIARGGVDVDGDGVPDLTRGAAAVAVAAGVAQGLAQADVDGSSSQAVRIPAQWTVHTPPSWPPAMGEAPALRSVPSSARDVARAALRRGEPVTVAALAAESGYSDTRIRTELDALVKAGLMTSGREPGSGRANVYRPAGAAVAGQSVPANNGEAL
jgi:hypothetical protein